jgi:hypothetical protein
LDVPAAPALLEMFEKMAMEEGCLPISAKSSSTDLTQEDKE